MTALTLLDVGQLPQADQRALGSLIGAYQGFFIAVYTDGALHCLIPTGVELVFLAHVARDISPVDIIAVPTTHN